MRAIRRPEEGTTVLGLQSPRGRLSSAPASHGRLTPTIRAEAGSIDPAQRCVRPASTAATKGESDTPAQAARMTATAEAPEAAASRAREGESIPPTATRSARPWGQASAVSVSAVAVGLDAVSYTHLRAHETPEH